MGMNILSLLITSILSGLPKVGVNCKQMNGHGGIYVIPLDLAQVGYKDKMAMIEAINKHTQS